MPLLPYDYLHLVNCPEVVTISDNYCICVGTLLSCQEVGNRYKCWVYIPLNIFLSAISAYLPLQGNISLSDWVAATGLSINPGSSAIILHQIFLPFFLSATFCYVIKADLFYGMGIFWCRCNWRLCHRRRRDRHQEISVGAWASCWSAIVEVSKILFTYWLHCLIPFNLADCDNPFHSCFAKGQK